MIEDTVMFCATHEVLNIHEVLSNRKEMLLLGDSQKISNTDKGEKSGIHSGGGRSISAMQVLKVETKNGVSASSNKLR